MNFLSKYTHVAIVVLGVCTINSPASAQNVVAWWSQINGSDTTPAPNGALTPLNLHARFVVHDTSLSAQTDAQALCDGFALDDQSGNALNVKWHARYNDVYYSEYAVCDGPLPSGQKLSMAKLSNATTGAVQASMRQPTGATKQVDVTFPGPPPVGRAGYGIRMTVFGDSGCRGKVRSGSQGCNGRPSRQSADWVFPDLIDASLTPSHLPDFVLHVGDYRYLDQSYSQNTWDWPHWHADLFNAAQPSFAQVPWAFSRGNHEVCDDGLKYSGVGFFLFFGRDLESCKSSNSINETTLMKPWYFDVADQSGNSPTEQHRIIMVDNASNSDKQAHIDDYKTAFEWAQTGWAGAAPSAWIASHRPIFGLDTDHEDQNDTRDLGFIQSALKIANNDVKRNCVPYNMKNCGLKAIIGGHQHNLQNVVFPADQSDTNRLLPQQFVVGNSGVRLRERTKDAFTHILHDGLMSGCGVAINDPDAFLGAQVTGAVMDWISRERGFKYEYGYVVFSRDGTQSSEQSGWSGDARFAYTSHAKALKGQLGTANLAGTGCVVQQ
jgi:hypothetical protein